MAYRVYRLCGRTGEDFKIGGAYVTIGEFERAIAKIEALSINYTIDLADVNNQMDLILTIECDAPNEHYDDARKLEQLLADTIEPIGGGLKVGFYHRFEVVLVPLGSLPRNPITGKIKKIIDHRVL